MNTNLCFYKNVCSMHINKEEDEANARARGEVNTSFEELSKARV